MDSLRERLGIDVATERLFTTSPPDKLFNKVKDNTGTFHSQLQFYGRLAFLTHSLHEKDIIYY